MTHRARKRAETRWEELLRVDLLSLRHEQATFGDSEGTHGLHRPPQIHLQPQQKSPSIMTVTPDALHSRKRVFRWYQHDLRSLLIRAVGTGHPDLQQVAPLLSTSACRLRPHGFFPYHSPSPGHARRWF